MKLIKRLLAYTWPYRGRFALGIGCMIVHSLITVFVFQVFKDLIDAMIVDISGSSSALRALTLLCLGLVGVFFLKGFAYYGQRYLTFYVAQRAMKDIRDELYKHLQTLPLGFYHKNKVGQIMSRIVNDVHALQQVVVSGAVDIFYHLITLIASVLYLVYLNPKLTLLMAVVIPAIIATFRFFSNKIRAMSRLVQESLADISDTLHESITGVRVVKSFVREDYEFARFAKQTARNFAANRKNAQLSAMLSPLVELFAAIGFTVVLWFGGYDVIHGRMTPGELIAFFTLALITINPLKSLSGLSHVLQGAQASAERIFDLLDEESDIEEIENPIHLDRRSMQGAITYQNVHFSYEPGREVLHDINLEIKPGEVVALVGPSGAGKSTLVDLIPRFYDPESGVVMVDGHDVKTLSLDSLRENIGIVPQETVVFSGTIRDNILYGDLDASEEAVIAAAKAANAHEFIVNLPDGYDTVVGENGVGLSGGQKQRIAIARAILKNPRILILDEATSALDSESEQLVQEALDRLMQNRTTLVIAHRLSTIQNADRIVVLDKGRIVESGTHDELMAKHGLYHHLYQTQFGTNSDM